MRKKLTLLLIVLFSISAASGLNFELEVDALTESSEYGIEYRNNTTVQQVNTTVLNGGSIGCQFRLKGEFRYANQTQTRYSNPYALFPGAETKMQLYFIPENYTGQVETMLYTEYCGQEKQLKQFNFSSPESVIANNTIESTTQSVNSTGSSIQIDSSDGRLVPKEAPAYWKTGSTQITNGTATIEYDAPIFQEGENLTYTVIDNQNNIVGETEVYLKAEKTIWDRLENNLLMILLGISVAANLALVILRLRERSS
jgi:type 1 fimbria pilin